MNQKLSGFASIAEIISSVAVVVTLVVLITEVRGNTSAIYASNRQSVAERTQDLSLTIATDPGLISRWAAYQDATVEYQRDSNLVFVMPKLVEESYLQYLDGLLSEEYWQTRAGIAVFILQHESTREVYAGHNSSGIYTPQFTAWLDQALAESYGWASE